MKTFIIIFVLAILVVVGSAAMMNYFTGRSTPTRQNKKPPSENPPENPE